MKKRNEKGQFVSDWEGEFMQPETFHGHWQVIRDTNEGTIFTPEIYAEYRGNEQAAKAYNVPIENIECQFGWGARLSTSGYLDSTDWLGVFKTEKAAMRALRELYGDQ